MGFWAGAAAALRQTTITDCRPISPWTAAQKFAGSAGREVLRLLPLRSRGDQLRVKVKLRGRCPSPALSTQTQPGSAGDGIQQGSGCRQYRKSGAGASASPGQRDCVDLANGRRVGGGRALPDLCAILPRTDTRLSFLKPFLTISDLGEGQGPRLRSSAMGPILLNLVSLAGCTCGHRGRHSIGRRRIAAAWDKGPYGNRPRIVPLPRLKVWR